jgi:hypothetical protein
MRRILIAAAALLLLAPAAEAHRSGDVRFATYNLSLNRPAAGDLVNHSPTRRSTTSSAARRATSPR